MTKKKLSSTEVILVMIGVVALGLTVFVLGVQQSVVWIMCALVVAAVCWVLRH